jgi:hypothetical protein
MGFIDALIPNIDSFSIVEYNNVPHHLVYP